MKIAFYNLLRHKSRSTLSVIGIIIGVAAIITMVSVVDGLFSEVNSAIGQVQGVRVLRSSNDPIFSRIDSSFAQKLESVRGVSSVNALVTGPIGSLDGTTISYGNTRVNGLDFSGGDDVLARGISGKIIEGREIRAGERNVAVIGKSIKTDFDKFLNQSVEINGEKFRIVGVYSAGSPLLESTVILSIDDARRVLNFPNDKVSGFLVSLVNPQDDKKIVNEINFRFGDDLKAVSASDLSEQFGGIIGSFRILVGAVAAISAVVAAVGIINTMLMSVLERFKEIGSLKAVGWTNSDIVSMVLIESVLISFIGAVGGIVVGFFAGFLISEVAGFTTLITFELLLQVFVFAFVVGIVSGAYPAFVASRMDVVEALRSE